MKLQFPCAVSLAAAALSAPLLAQTQVQAQPTAPPKRVLFDYSTGVVTPIGDDAGAIQALLNEVVTLDNTAFSGSFYAPGTTAELADYGRTAGAPGASLLDPGGPVCEFTVGYATSEPGDPANPPVSLVVAFYANDEATAGGCDGLAFAGTGLGTELARFTLTGLPGDDIPGDGLAAGWETTISLRGPQDGGFILPPGGVAWTIEVASDPLLTGPLLVTPAGVGCGPPASNSLPGTSDCFDVFSPGGGGGSCAGTFSFTTPDIASFWMRVVQEQVLAPLAVHRSNGNEGALLVELNGFPMVAGCDNVTIPCPTAVVVPISGSGLSAADFWSFSRTPDSVPIPGITGDLLIGLSTILQLIEGPGSVLTVPRIPAFCNLVGLTIFSQGGFVDAVTLEIALSNALDYEIGTYF